MARNSKPFRKFERRLFRALRADPPTDPPPRPRPRELGREILPLPDAAQRAAMREAEAEVVAWRERWKGAERTVGTDGQEPEAI